MGNKSVFNPEEFLSDKPLTAQEQITLNKALDRTKVQLFYENNAGFLAALVATMEFVWDRTIPTACTNGVFMAWNPEFFLSLSPRSRVTVLAHEAWHVAYDHMGRIAGRNLSDYNEAADHVINNMLKEHGYDMSGFPFLMDPAYSGMSTDEVYEKIQSGGRHGNNPQNGDFAEPGQGPASINQGKTPNQIKQKATGNLMDAAVVAKMNGMEGDIPQEVQEMIDAFLNPKLDWRVLLSHFFEALTSVEFSYSRPNRRYTDIILPGKTGRNGLEKLNYYLDVSGSVSEEEVLRFNSEVKYIKDTFNPETLTLVLFDHKIEKIIEIDEDDEFDKVEILGRGGTSLGPVYSHIHKTNPTAVVIFTDLCVNIPEDPPGPPLIWVCSNNPTAEVPYGKLIHIDETGQ